MEEFEDVIEDWYRNHQEDDISQFLCANHVLKGKDTSEFLFWSLGLGDEIQENQPVVFK